MNNNKLYEELDKNITVESEITKLPAMYIFVNNLLSELQDLNLREGGAFIRLFLQMWRNGGSIPDNNKTIGRYLGNISQKEVKKIREKLAFKLEFCEGSITIPGLQKQYNDAVKKHKDKSRAGSMGGKVASNSKHNHRQKGVRKVGDVLQAIW